MDSAEKIQLLYYHDFLFESRHILFGFTKILRWRKMPYYNIFICKGNEILKANVIVYGHQSNTSLEIMNSILYTLGPILRPT